MSCSGLDTWKIKLVWRPYGEITTSFSTAIWVYRTDGGITQGYFVILSPAIYRC